MRIEGADAEVRRRALDPGASFIVQAPAGSGKTGLLTQRFLRLLALVDAPEQIVAITFTRKAAAEMRRRIVLALRGVEPGEDAVAEHDRLTRELARAARARADEKGWALEQHPARLRIHTIDAFCSSLAAQSPVLARAGSELEVADDARELYRDAARRTLGRVAAGDAAGEAVAALLMHRDNQVPATEDLIVRMLGRRDQWLPLVLELSGAALRERLERDLGREILGHLHAVIARWPAHQLQLVSQLIAGAADRLDGDALGPWRGNSGAPRAELQEVARWRVLAGMVLVRDPALRKRAWRRQVDARVGFPPAARADRDAMEQLLAELGQDAGLRRELAWLQEVPDARLSEEQWRTVEALIDVLKLAAAELELVFRETGQVDYPAVLNAALNAIGGADTPTELALSLDRRIRHLLVDEYQDTSSAQFRLLTALTREWIPGDGRSVFCVGDPMQSIYRFRQAEVGLFLRTRDRGLGNVALQPLRLESNFRSQRSLVEWFNRVFAGVLPGADDIARGAVCHAPSAAVHVPLDPAVCVHPFFTSEPDTETEAILGVLESVRASMPEARIGILTRQRPHVAHLAAALRERGLRFQAVELETLASRPVVRDLLALTRALLHEADRTAWLAVLRSPACGLTLADLEALTRDAPRRTVRELLGDSEVMNRLSVDGRRRAVAAHSALEQALTSSGHVSLGRRVEGLWLALGGPATARHAASLEDAASFFDHLRKAEERGALPAGDAFDAKFVELYAEPDPHASALLQVMTIHKAKGLEFDAVLLPGLGRGRTRHEPPLLHWLEVAQLEGPAGLLLAPIARKGVDSDPHAKYVAERQRECAAFESARLLYVAVTRARRELHLFGHVKLKEKDGVPEMGAPEFDSALALLWPAVRATFEAAFARRPPDAGPAAVVAPRAALRRHASTWSLPLAAQSVGTSAARTMASAALQRPTFEWASEVSRHVGTAVHAELDRWSRVGALPGAAQVAASGRRFERVLASLGVPAHEREAAVQRVIAALTRTLADERGRWIFATGHRQARSELALSGTVGGVLINAVIDRTFVDGEGTRWIVDFKTGSHEGGAVEEFLDNEVVRYRDQLARYAALVAGHGPEPLRAGLYFPMLAGWREWSLR